MNTQMAFGSDELSGSGSDGGFDEDMDALRKACMLNGTNPNNLGNISDGETSAAASESEDGEDDLEVLRNIQKRFSVDDAHEPLNLKPICSLPPVFDSDDDDDGFDDDFEILRAIQRRFSDYDNESAKKSMGDSLHKLQVGATSIDLEKRTSSNLLTGRTNIGEGFPDSVDTSISRHVSESLGDSAPGCQPSGFLEWHESGAENVASSTSRDSGFPKSAQAFLDAIKKNRSCQKYLRSKLIQIETRIEENKKLRDSVKVLKDFQAFCRKRTRRALSQKKDALVKLISVPKLRANAKAKEKDRMYCGPAENSHVPNYRMVLQNFPISLSRDKWTEEEDENLVKGIKQQFQDMLLQKTYQQEMSRKKSDDILSNADGFSGDSNDLDSIIALIAELDITHENMRVFLPKVNWDRLASMYVTGRSGAECEARWLNWKDPLINKGSWTKLEEKHLLSIVRQKGITDWIDIAVALGTKRTPFQCLIHYQRSLNSSIVKSEWTKDEDDKLRDAVATFGESDWQSVASALEGRKGTQCSNRWMKSLHPMRQRIGTWNTDEDTRLKVAVMLFGAKNWRNIAEYVVGRTHVQCRERWKNCLDPTLKLCEWSEEEDLRLKVAFAEHGHCWRKVAGCVPGRTDNQCLRRWKMLFPHEVPLLQAARKIRKAALISNFVDRESNRPALGPHDFVPALKSIGSAPETDNTDSRGKRKRKSRSKSCRSEAQTRSEGDLRPTDGDENENLSAEEYSLWKKRGKQLCSNNRNSSTRDILPPAADTTLLTITNGGELGAHGSNTTAIKKKAPGRQKRNTRGRAKSNEADTASRHVSILTNERMRNPSSDPTDTNAGEGVVNEATNSDVVETFGGDDAISTIKRRKNKLHSKKNKGTNSSELVVFDEEGEAVDRNDATKKKDLSIRRTRLPSPTTSPETVMENVDDHNDERPPRCQTPDIMDNWNPKEFTVCRKSMHERSRSSGGICSSETRITEIGDDSTLAFFFNQSRKSKKSTSSFVKFSDLLLERCSKSATMVDGSQNIPLPPRCSTSDTGEIRKICSDQMCGGEDDDDMPLAYYLSRLKKKNRELAKNCEDIHS